MNFWAQVTVVLSVALFASVGSALVHPKRPAWFEVQSAEMLRWQISVEGAAELAEAGLVVWIDARDLDKFESAHLPGALSLRVDEWGDTMFENQEALQAAFGNPVVVYCDGNRCDKSVEVARNLREQLGLDPVYVLKGDWRELLSQVAGE